jgi:hypothetical protein
MTSTSTTTAARETADKPPPSGSPLRGPPITQATPSALRLNDRGSTSPFRVPCRQAVRRCQATSWRVPASNSSSGWVQILISRLSRSTRSRRLIVVDEPVGSRPAPNQAARQLEQRRGQRAAAPRDRPGSLAVPGPGFGLMPLVWIRLSRSGSLRGDRMVSVLKVMVSWFPGLTRSDRHDTDLETRKAVLSGAVRPVKWGLLRTTAVKIKNRYAQVNGHFHTQTGTCPAGLPSWICRFDPGHPLPRKTLT